MIMNLGKLLAAGKSVVNGNGAIEYHESKQALLPRFDSPKKPFVRPFKPLPEAAAAPVKETAPMPAKPQPMPPISDAPKSLAAWTSKLNPASVWRGPRVEPQNSPRPEVQAELSLDTVKVVHNDLSDADVEVVPIKSRPPVPDESAVPPPKSWEILSKRILKHS